MTAPMPFPAPAAPAVAPAPPVTVEPDSPLSRRQDAAAGADDDARFGERFARQQQAQLMRTLPGALLARLLALPMFAWLWPDGAWTPEVAATLAVLAAVGLAQGAHWLRFRRSGGVQAPGTGLQAALAGLSAVAFANLLMLALPLQGEGGRFVLSAFALAYYGAAVLFYAPMWPVALSWILSACAAFALGLLRNDLPGTPWLAGLLPLLGLFMMGVVVETVGRARERLRRRERVERDRETLALLLHDFESQATDWLWEADCEGRLLRVSAHLAEALGRPVAQLRNQPMAALLGAPRGQREAGVHDAAALAARLAQCEAFADWKLAWTRDGEPRWWSLRARPVHDGHQRWIGWRGVAHDITERMLQQQALRRLALTDAATGLANRNGFLEALRGLIDAAAGARVGLFLLDLDQFKTVKLALGHPRADEVLNTLAQCLGDLAQAMDLTPARLDGDEFALAWIERSGPAGFDPLVLDGTLRAALALSLAHGPHEVELRASVGLALADSAGLSCSELMRRADMALVAAKRQGGNRQCAFEPAMDEAQRRRERLEAELKRAIEARSLSLAYQPKWTLQGERLVGVEALARWQHPELGVIPPSEFIPLAEDAGLIQALGQAVLERACREAAAWPGELPVAVNVSAVQLEALDFPAVVRQALQQAGLPAHRLELELTESVFVQDAERLVQRLHALRETGVSVALDDFGTGYSSLAYLQRLPLSTLKIDRAFVKGLDAEAVAPKAEAIVSALVQLAGAIGASTVAEGIETPAQREALLRLGCEVGQGYLLGRPVPPDEIPRLLGPG